MPTSAPMARSTGTDGKGRPACSTSTATKRNR